MNRKHLVVGLVLALIVALVCAVSALAEDDHPLKVSMQLSKNTLSAPEEITVSITVTNVGESDLPGPVTLYYPSGKQVEDFGSPELTVGTSKNWTGTWKVTQAQLDAGRITFKLKYSLYNYEGELANMTYNFSKKLIYSSAEPELTVNRTIKPTTAQEGQEITITYEIENVGTSDVSSVTIKENSAISSKNGTIESIAAGEKGSYTFTTTMKKKNLTSSATITYKAGNKSYTKKVDAEVIKYGVVNLTATVEADKKGGAPGETVNLKVKLKNSGTVDFTGVKVTDDALGELFTDVTVPAKETVTLEKALTITETQDIQLSVTAQDATGQPLETATGKLTVIATDPTKQIVLSVLAESDRTQVYELPGSVNFTITVTNESAVDVSNIVIKAVNTTINTIPSLAAGDSYTFTRKMAASMTGSYQFTASCKNELDETLTFSSNAIRIELTHPTAEPVEVTAPPPTAPKYEKVPESYDELDASVKLPEWTDRAEGIASEAKWYIGGVAAFLLLLLLIGFIRRGIRKAHSNKAMDHLEGANYRDYSAEPRRGKRNVVSNGSDSGSGKTDEKAGKNDEKKDGEKPASQVSSETLQRLYRSNDVKEGADAGKKAEQKAEEAAKSAAENVKEAVKNAADEAAKEAKAAKEADENGVHRRRRS